MCQRVDGKAGAVETPIGLLPRPEDLDLRGLDVPPEDLRELLRVDVDAWRAEIPDIERHFAQFGDRLPRRLREQFATTAGPSGVEENRGWGGGLRPPPPTLKS
jgi:phosphoenolpyruvate carboxykinase (GTP)